MKSSSKPKTIHYKSVFVTGDVNIQVALNQALSKEGPFAKPSKRQQKVNQDDETVVFINKFSDMHGMTFGQLVTLETGKKQPFITVDDDADFYSIDSLASEKIPELSVPLNKTSSKGAPAKPGITKEDIAKKRREFLDSILYFGVINNHMVIMQSSSLRSRELEAHLSWLLSDCAGVITKGSMLVLKDKPAETVYQKMQSKPVKSIRLGAPLTTDINNNPSAPGTHETKQTESIETHANKIRFTPTGTAASLLRAALPEGFLERLQLDDSLDEANIHVALEITYLRKTTKNGQKVIDSIATSLRHTPESDVEINLQGGGKIRGDELKLSGNISVKYMENGLIDESILFHEMHKWLFGKISSSEIDSGDEVG